MALFFIASKKICKPPRFCLARIPLARLSIARVVVVVKIFTTPENISSYFCFALYFRIPRCPACHGVRRARRKTFLREESEWLFENNNKQTSTPSKHLLSAKTYFFNVLSIFHTKNETTVQNTFMFLVLFFVFFPMALFFIASKKFANHRGSV